MDQLNQILHYLGTPDEATLARIGSPRAQDYVRNLPFMAKIPFHTLFRQANPDALDLLDKMLAFDPSGRIGVEEALGHRYLSVWHDPSDEPTCGTPFDFTFEIVEDVPQMKQMILDEVKRFRGHVRQRPDAQVPQMQVPPSALPPGAQQQNGMSIPDNYDSRMSEDPRPEQTQDKQGTSLEDDLQRGLDAMR